jgi:hypothetical protein
MSFNYSLNEVRRAGKIRDTSFDLRPEFQRVFIAVLIGYPRTSGPLKWFGRLELAD